MIDARSIARIPGIGHAFVMALVVYPLAMAFVRRHARGASPAR